MPLYPTPIRAESLRFLRTLLSLFLLISLGASSAFPQGFAGRIGGKKKLYLHRKLPALINVTAKSFSLKAVAQNKDHADVAQSLSDLLETELLKNNHHMVVDKSSSDIVISCIIMHFDTPPPQTFTRNEVVLEKGHNLEEPKNFYKMAGTLEVAYQTKSRSGTILDSANLSAKYSRDFEANTNQAGDKSLRSKITDPFKRAAGKKTEESSGPPTALDIRQDLLHQVVSQITMRLVSTDETLEVYLARGKLDEADKLAEAGLWTRNLETLERMPPLSNPRDDAYRLYNIGVAYEAMGYQSEDRAAAKTFFEEAAINYGKAIDAKPDERYFHEPQTRIESAVAYYRTLEERQGHAEAPTSANNAAEPKRSVHASDSIKVTGSKKPAAGQPPATNAAIHQIEADTEPALTNQKVIEMLKSGVDEDNITSTIRQARRVQFDVSPDGQIQLAKNGVKGKILAAMRERAARTQRSLNH